MKHTKDLQVEDPRVVWDIEPKDFCKTGCFANLQKDLTNISYSHLIAEEAERVKHFLDEWEKQLTEFEKGYFQIGRHSLSSLFLQTPKLSGVTYLSNNYVISEAFFDAEREGLEHLTDREVCIAIQNTLPWSKELTFSFPRKYCFFGYTNSWGFIRFPRQDDKGTDAGVLISCTTLDPRIMNFLAKAGFCHLASLYNRAWDGAIHDYIHHIGLYTNPSFGIGKLSPMSITKVHNEIESWGNSMMSTFNYEYWAHKSHRLITAETLTEAQKEIITDKACQYIEEVYRFYNQLIVLDLSAKDVEEVIGYLLTIYLWPLGVLLHPQSKWIQKIGCRIDEGPFIHKKIPVLTIADLLIQKGQISDNSLKALLASDSSINKIRGIRSFVNQATSGIELGIAYMLKGLGLENWDENSTLSWYEWLRAYTDIVARRGLYENWYHQLPIIFDGKEMHPHKVTLLIVEHVAEALSLIEKSELISYQLSGIVA